MKGRGYWALTPGGPLTTQEDALQTPGNTGISIFPYYFEYNLPSTLPVLPRKRNLSSLDVTSKRRGRRLIKLCWILKEPSGVPEKQWCVNWSQNIQKNINSLPHLSQRPIVMFYCVLKTVGSQRWILNEETAFPYMRKSVWLQQEERT